MTRTTQDFTALLAAWDKGADWATEAEFDGRPESVWALESRGYMPLSNIHPFKNIAKNWISKLSLDIQIRTSI